MLSEYIVSSVVDDWEKQFHCQKDFLFCSGHGVPNGIFIKYWHAISTYVNRLAQFDCALARKLVVFT